MAGETIKFSIAIAIFTHLRKTFPVPSYPSELKSKASNLHHYLGDRIAVIGMGRSGLATLGLLKLFPEFFPVIDCYDDYNPQYPAWTTLKMEEKKYTSLIISPGIPLRNFWEYQNRYPLQIFNEIDLASFFLQDEIVIATTGSAGKSTVVTLIDKCLQANNESAFTGGNLGNPFCHYVTDVLARGQKAKYINLEVSSYHLENLKFLKPQYGIITCLTPNHLDRYRDLEEYYVTKFYLAQITQKTLFLNPHGDLMIYGDQYLCHPQKIVTSWRKHSSPTIRSASGQIQCEIKKVYPEDFPDFSWNHLLLLGAHNRNNVALSWALMSHLSLANTQNKEALYTFPGLAHRLETIVGPSGYLFINDSKATTVESVVQAAEAVYPHGKKRIHLLIGGKDKNLKWSDLLKLKKYDRIQFHFFGEAAQNIKKITSLDGPVYPSLKEALKQLASQLQVGDTVLLSPGGSSLDEFRSFEERGQLFKDWVQSLQSK